MSLIRQEITETLRRWREVIVWAALVALGLWMAIRGYNAPSSLSFVVGVLLTGAGLGLARGALRRLWLSDGQMGEGVVAVDEARIGFLGPRDGGYIDIPSISAVDVTRLRDGASAWVLRSTGGDLLTIPVAARGAEALFDALSALPGIDLDAAEPVLRGREAGPVAIWRRDQSGDVRRLN